jgi:hypothetical protein
MIPLLGLDCGHRSMGGIYSPHDFAQGHLILPLWLLLLLKRGDRDTEIRQGTQARQLPPTTWLCTVNLTFHSAATPSMPPKDRTTHS